jgi:hypothetical protein
LYHFGGWFFGYVLVGMYKPASLLGFYDDSAEARTQDQRLIGDDLGTTAAPVGAVLMAALTGTPF